MQALVAFISAIVVCHAATTHRPHTTGSHHGHNGSTDAHSTHEPHEYETVSFQFQGVTGHLLVTVQADKTTFSCYIGTLTDAEHAQIHTDVGMRAVESGLLARLSSATLVTDSTTLDQHDVKGCGTHGSIATTFYTITA